MSAFRGTALGWIVALAAVLLMGVPNTARAIGLGEARVDSYLNQPLDIRIRLLDASETELDSLTVGPATPADYQRLGVGSSALALDLAFEVDRSVSPAVIRITSSRSVADPILQLLVDARWSSGRMLREYTLFLDPPTLDIAPPPAPARSETRPSAPAQPPTERPVRQAPRDRAEPAATRPAAQAARTRDGGQRMVRSGDTLWSIARANLPAGDVSMNQMMVAIVELNPQAFRNGNIHQMLRGSRLELPDAAQAQAIDRARAAATVQAQNRAFNRRLAGDVPVVSDAARGADEATDTPSTPDPAPSADAATAAREPEPEARLELVPSTEESTGSGLEEDGAEVDRLRQQLARTEEELFAARLESEEFRSRLSDLEAMVEQNPNGMGIADAELAGLEQTLRAARLAASEDADPALREEVTAQLDGYLAQFESAADAAASTMDEPLVDAPDPVDEEPVTQQPVAEEPVAEEPVVTQVGGADRAWWSGPLVLPLAGLIVLVILLRRSACYCGADGAKPTPSSRRWWASSRTSGRNRRPWPPPPTATRSIVRAAAWPLPRATWPRTWRCCRRWPARTIPRGSPTRWKTCSNTSRPAPSRPGVRRWSWPGGWFRAMSWSRAAPTGCPAPRTLTSPRWMSSTRRARSVT